MDYWMSSALESLLFIGMFLLATAVLIPKAVQLWRLWMTTGKPIYLSHAVATGIGGLFFLLGVLLMLLQATSGGVGDLHS
jgi:hypothetical protein